jgi:FMN-dependent NADH-azoreductase
LRLLSLIDGVYSTAIVSISPEPDMKILQINAIARNGVTFRYTDQRPEGLLKGKRVYLAVARGGRYRDTPADSQTPYLKTVLSFLGMTDLHFVYAEGLNMGPESAARGFADAEADLAAALA